MAQERYCEIRDEHIVNTIVVDPDTQQGAMYLALMEEQGSILLPEAEALERYPL